MGNDEQGQPIPYNEWTAALEAIIPAFTMTTLIAGGHSVLQRYNRQKNFKAHADANAPVQSPLLDRQSSNNQSTQRGSHDASRRPRCGRAAQARRPRRSDVRASARPCASLTGCASSGR